MAERGRDRYSRSRYGSNASRERSLQEGVEPPYSDAYPGENDPAADYSRDSYVGRGGRARRSAASEEANDASSIGEHVPGDEAGRATEAERGATPSKRGRASSQSGRRGLKVAVVAIIAAVVIGVGVAFAYVSSVSSNLHEGVDQGLRDALVHTDMANEPFYMLLLGTDASAWREETGETDGVYRTDSMILARIDAPKKKVTLISIGRDITVDLGEYGEQKINAAYAFGGAALAVETVSKFADVPISHYAEVNFDGFAAIVDALGGVEVDVPIEIYDLEAGYDDVIQAGPQTLNGIQALAVCRSRNSYAYTAARPDDMRTANQRLVLSAIARKALDSDIATIAATVQTVSNYVTTDLELNDIIGLAQALRGLNPDTDIYTASVPVDGKLIDDGYYDFVKKSEWNAMMKRVKAGEPPVEEAQIDEITGTILATAGNGASLSGERYATVNVMNGTDIDGLASSVRKELLDAGYVNVVLGDATGGFDYPNTHIVYDEPGRKREADDIVSILGQGVAYENDGEYLMPNCDIMVLIGDDWQQ